uniref:non-specific serine/threonine protein kinase n=1 Tax=Melanopsichium pennsylvanicum 4 TaxID=1398559 RepID=A0A077QZC9_9BASI|nr:serine threonine kinase [Melanopsichium pennsylvanicum 4]
MSFLSAHTKKVSVYGRKAEVRVINRNSTFNNLNNDENDPFGFFNAQPKPSITHGRSRASVLPAEPLSEHVDSKNDTNNQDPLDSRPASDQSAAYKIDNSSLSFQSASSSTSPPILAHSKAGPRMALASQAINTKEQSEAETQITFKPRKPALKTVQEDAQIMSTPKAKQVYTKRVAAQSPETATKPPRAKGLAPTSRATAVPSTDSTPLSRQPAARVPRRAAQQARMAIEDYDFTDRDMTPRRPVPTKSYFVEKARQLAELAAEQEKEFQQPEPVSATRLMRSRKSMAPTVRSNPRKSMAPRPSSRRTTAPATSAIDAIAILDSSLSSANGISDSSYEGGSTSQSSFSLIIPSYNVSEDPPPKRSAAAKAKALQNKRVTRRIVVDSDEEEDRAGIASDHEIEQDPALQLAAQVAELVVEEGDEVLERDSHLSELLTTVSQTKPEPFADTISRLRTFVGSAKMARRRLEKIGEASYSEVFKIPSSSDQEAVVLKIIPITSPSSQDSTVDTEDDLPYSSPAADVEREIRLMKLISSQTSHTDSFVSLQSAHIVRGSYPSTLLQAWDRWDAKRRTKTGEGAENVRPHVLGRTQVYALLVMTDGGVDLESLKVKSWTHAASIFWQVVKGLGEMEELYEFEHRDLHWGNILVQTVTPESRDEQGAANFLRTHNNWLLDPTISGVKATIIDFTLSRATPSAANTTTITTKSRSRTSSNSVPLYCPFDDNSLFEGEGDPQFQVYREMKSLTKGEWSCFWPGTNVLWLRYLVHKLVDVKCKSIKVPKGGSSEEVAAEMEAYDSLIKAAEKVDRDVLVMLNGREEVKEEREEKNATAKVKSFSSSMWISHTVFIM